MSINPDHFPEYLKWLNPKTETEITIEEVPEIPETDDLDLETNDLWEAVAIVGIVVAGFVAIVWRYTR